MIHKRKMKTLSKQLFISTIAQLRDQQDSDFEIANTLSGIYGEVAVYNNSKLTTALFDLLGFHFPEQIADIKIFCFELDYGRNTITENDPIEDLWLTLQPRYIVGYDPFEVTTPVFPIQIPNWHTSHTKMIEKQLDEEFQALCEKTAEHFDAKCIIEKGIVFKRTPDKVVENLVDDNEFPEPNMTFTSKPFSKVSENIKNIEVVDFVVVSPLKKFSIEDD